MKEILKTYVYTTAQSNAMNGISAGTQIVYVNTWWQNLIVGIKICIWCTYSYFGSTLSCKSEKNGKEKEVNSMKETKKLSTSSWLTLAAAGYLGLSDWVAYSTSEVAVKQIGIIAAIAIVLNIITIVVNMKYSFGILNLSSHCKCNLFSVAFV